MTNNASKRIDPLDDRRGSVSEPAPTSSQRRIALALRGMAIAIPLFFLLPRLDRIDLWQDEANELLIARGAQEGTWSHIARSEMRPPLRYYLLDVWQGVSADDWWLRSLSTLCFLASIPLVHRIARRELGERTAPLASFVFATSAYQISTGLFVRSYSLDVFVTLVAANAWLSLRSAERISVVRFRDRVAAVAATALAGATSYFALAAVGVVALSAVASKLSRTSRKRMLGLGLVCAALHVPLLPLAWAQHGHARDHAWQALRPGAENLRMALVAPALGRVKNWELDSPLQLAIALGFFALVTAAILTFRRRAAALVVWWVVPTTVLFALSQIGPNLFILRTLNVFTPPLYMLVGASLTRLRRTGIALALMWAVLGPAYLATTEDLRSTTQGIAAATGWLSGKRAETDWPVVHADQFTWFPFTTYGGGPSRILAESVPWNWGATQIPAGTLVSNLSFPEGTEGFFWVEKRGHYKDRFDRWFRRERILASSGFLASDEVVDFDRVLVIPFVRTDPSAATQSVLEDRLRWRAERFPTDAYPVFALGILELKRGELDHADEHFVEAMTRAPDWSYVPLQLGLSLARRGRLEEAVLAFDRARRLDPDNEQARDLWERARRDLEARRGSKP